MFVLKKKTTAENEGHTANPSSWTLSLVDLGGAPMILDESVSSWAFALVPAAGECAETTLLRFLG